MKEKNQFCDIWKGKGMTNFIFHRKRKLNVLEITSGTFYT